MPYEIIHFRESDEILKKKRLVKDVQATLDYVDELLYGALYKRELTNIALEEMGWRESGTLNVLDGRRYQYKGFKKGVAIEGNFAAYEYILEGLFRLQIGFDKGQIETGILFLNGFRGEKSSYGTSRDLAASEVEQLYPTISMPISIALFDIGKPQLITDEEGTNGVSIPADDQRND